jgi:hypothetical protein
MISENLASTSCSGEGNHEGCFLIQGRTFGQDRPYKIPYCPLEVCRGR